jgi:regulator of protease activity HflC (stomatin/prohibitin superfamily)
MAEREIRERDILVASNEFAYVQDLTKGDIVLYVGPTKISLSNTERLVELRGDRFAPARSEEPGAGVQPFVVASSAQYIVLENPPRDPAVRPVKGSNAALELLVGRRVVVPGPASFPLWPGQRARVVDGHRLREDEYLVVRVYDRIEDDDGPIGSEHIVRGSDTSFYLPRTGLEVVPHDGGYVRRARRLRLSSGLHLRVLRSFTAEVGDAVPPGAYQAGQDVFLAGREGFFFPTDRFEIVAEVSAIPLAEGEGLYVRDLESGRIDTVEGPRTYLPDPTRVEVVSRPVAAPLAALYGVPVARPAGRALSIAVPPNTAIMVTAGSRREVVRGPRIRPLGFEEELEVLALSTGRPKSDAALLSTCFLQLEGNKVSDLVRLETADHVTLEVALSYRVSFITHDGAPEKWFHVKNYVGLLCDHLGSLIRAAARSVGIDAFHAGGTEILRAALLGDKRGDGKRAGRLFEENDMWLYDVEVLDVTILDAEVAELLADAQRTAILFQIDRKREELRLSTETLREEVTRQIHQAQLATSDAAERLEVARRQVALAQATSKVETERTGRLGQARTEAEAVALTAAARLDAAARDQELEHRALEARVAAFREQMAALHPELVATLHAVGNRQAAAELTRNLAPLAILGGNSVAEVAARLFGALPLGAGSQAASALVAPAAPAAPAKKVG